LEKVWEKKGVISKNIGGLGWECKKTVAWEKAEREAKPGLGGRLLMQCVRGRWSREKEGQAAITHENQNCLLLRGGLMSK